MKRQLRPYLYSIIILFCLLFLFSVIFSALYAGSVINKNVYDILLLICGYLSFLCGGLCFGFFIEKKALFQALFVSLLLAGASFFNRREHSLDPPLRTQPAVAGSLYDRFFAAFSLIILLKRE